jgi:hypothetical protein
MAGHPAELHAVGVAARQGEVHARPCSREVGRMDQAAQRPAGAEGVGIAVEHVAERLVDLGEAAVGGEEAHADGRRGKGALEVLLRGAGSLLGDDEPELGLAALGHVGERAGESRGAAVFARGEPSLDMHPARSAVPAGEA